MFNPELNLQNIIGETPSKLEKIFKYVEMPLHFFSVIRSMITLNRKKPEYILNKKYFKNIMIKNIL